MNPPMLNSHTCHRKDADEDADIPLRQHHVFGFLCLPRLRLPCREDADEEDDEIEGNDDHERRYVQVSASVSSGRTVIAPSVVAMVESL